MTFNPIPDQQLTAFSTELRLDLSQSFDIDAITGSLVRLDINAKGPGNALFIELFDRPSAAATRTTPLTVANFLDYVERGAYTNAIFHRFALFNDVNGKPDRNRPFVLQGGGFALPQSSAKPLGYFPPTAIPASASVLNEPGNTNVLGTVAMAKTSDPNSATNQFFFNLSNDNAFLDNPANSGGFTAFGRLVANSLATLQNWIADVVIANGGDDSPYAELPLQGYRFAKQGSPFNPLKPSNYLAINKAQQVGEFTYKVKAKGAKASVSFDGQLQLQWKRTPTKPVTVTVRATSVLDPTESYSDTFVVNPATPAAAAPAGLAASTPLVLSPFGSDPLLAGFSIADPLA